MTTRRHLKGLVLALAGLVSLVASGVAQAAGPRISQVAHQPPDLAVFLSSEILDAPPKAKESPSTVSAALGDLPLPVKAAAPWDASTGVALVVAVDVSASLGPAAFKTLQQHVGAVLAQLPPRSQVALLAIGEQVRSVRPFGPPADAVTALGSLRPDSPETALYEGVLAAQALAAQGSTDLPMRRAVLVLTDGIDDSRRGYSRDEALQKIARGEAPVLVMALTPAQVSPSQHDAVRALAQIARASGGDFAQAPAAKVGDSLKHLLNQMARVHLVTLDCAACPHDGAVRTLQVSVRQRDGSTMTDARELRLLAIPSANAASRAGEAASAASDPPVGPKTATRSWQWWVAGLALLGAGAFTGFVWWRRQQQRTRAAAQAAERQQQAAQASAAAIASTRVEPASPAPLEAPRPVQDITLDVAARGRLHLRVGEDTVLGRSRQADVSIEHDAEASSRHAALYLERGVLMLRDLGSSNGTFLNGTRIARPEPLHDRDLLLIGRTEMRLYLGRL
jgi:hypothetical protein